MAITQTRWHIAGGFFENCNCKGVCPCLFSANPPFSSRPTEGDCEVFMAFHIDSGSYDNTPLDGLNVVMAARTPEAMGEGNWSVALYFDERANEQQRQALQAIFSGTVGGPLGLLAPWISTVLGAKTVPITYTVDGKHRSVEIPNIMHAGVQAFPSMDPDNQIWALNAHPFSPKLALGVGEQNSTWTDYGMSWDNSGRYGHYAAINWSNA